MWIETKQKLKKQSINKMRKLKKKIGTILKVRGIKIKITEPKISLESFHNRLDQKEKIISKLRNGIYKIIQSEKQKEINI